MADFWEGASRDEVAQLVADRVLDESRSRLLEAAEEAAGSGLFEAAWHLRHVADSLGGWGSGG